MPPLIRALATILIGTPGAIMQFGGLILLGFGIPATALDSDADYVPRLSILGGFAAIAVVGFSMVTLVGLMNGIRRFQMPARRLPAYIGMELLEQLLFSALIGIFVTAFVLAGANGWLHFGIWSFATCLVGASLAFCISRRKACGSKWRQDSPEAPPLPGFLSS